MRPATAMAVTVAGAVALGVLVTFGVRDGVDALLDWEPREPDPADERSEEVAGARADAEREWDERLRRTHAGLRDAGWTLTARAELVATCHDGSADWQSSSESFCELRSDAQPSLATAALLPEERAPFEGGGVVGDPVERERRTERGRALLRLAAATDDALAAAGWTCDGRLADGMPVLSESLANPDPQDVLEPFNVAGTHCTARVEGLPGADLAVQLLPPWQPETGYEPVADPSVRLIARPSAIYWPRDT